MARDALTTPDAGLSPEIERLLAEVHRYALEVQSIEAAAAQVWRSVEGLSTAFDGAGDAVLGGIQAASKETFKRSGAKDALKVAGLGLVIGGVAKGVGAGVALIGGAYAAVKEERALARSLKLKQEIARKKLASTEKLIRPLKRAHARLDELVARDARKILSRDKLSRTPNTQRMLERVFFGATRAKISLAWVEYLTAEFQAWLGGSQGSARCQPSSLGILQTQIDALLRLSIPRERESRYDVLAELPQGMVLALRHPTIRERAVGDPWLDGVVRDVTVAKARASLFPVGKRRQFLSEYQAVLGDEPFMQSKSRRLQQGYFLAVAAGLLSVGFAGYGAYSLSVDSAGVRGASMPAPSEIKVEVDRTRPPAAPLAKKTVAPTATQDIVAVDSAVVAGPASIFEAICGAGNATEIGCAKCPPGADFVADGGPWEAVKSSAVRLLGAESADRVVTMSGCEFGAHSTSVAVTRTEDGGWEKAVVLDRTDVDSCTKIEFPDGREGLACQSVEVGGGDVQAELIVVHSDGGDVIPFSLLTFSDNAGACPRELKSESVDSVVVDELGRELVVEVSTVAGAVPEPYEDWCDAEERGLEWPGPTVTQHRFEFDAGGNWVAAGTSVLEPAFEAPASDFVPILGTPKDEPDVPVFAD